MFASHGQRKTTRKAEADSLTKVKFETVNAFLNLTADDSIADIGTGTGYSLVPIASACPTCRFMVEDIDSNSCNKKALSNRINKTGNRTNIDNFTFRYGNEKSTGLADSAFNKVLIFDVIHEITYKTEMLADIKRILKKGGSVFIEEILVHNKVKKDKVCNYPFLTETEFKQLLAGNDFPIKREQVTFDRGNNRYIKIFECIP
jgi:ubiquinone/menaquinone biosynthesis C-methylase UbiE